jgi:phosphatidylinositol glycan class S
MMGLLYFPDEHKFAVYTPLFAPIGISMTIALLREAVAWQKRKAAAKKAGKEKKAADAAEDNGEQTVSGVSTAVEVK